MGLIKEMAFWSLITLFGSSAIILSLHITRLVADRILNKDTTVSAVGENTNGQLKTGEWYGIVSVAAGRAHSVALTKRGNVLVASSYKKLKEAEQWSSVTAISAGNDFIVGLTSSGEVKIIGLGAEEQLEQLAALMQSESWTSNDIVAIAAGGGYQEDEKSDVYYITALIPRGEI